MQFHQIDRSRASGPADHQPFYLKGLGRHWLSYYRVHLLIGLVIVGILALFFGWLINVGDSRSNAVNSALASSAAIVFASLTYGNSRQYSGQSSISLFLTTLIISHICAIAMMFFTRIDYSRLVLIACFSCASLWFTAAAWFTRKNVRLMFAVLPFGPVERLKGLTNARMKFAIIDDPLSTVINCNAIIADTRCDFPEHWERFLMLNTLNGVPVLSLKSFIEMVTGRVDIEHLSENSLASLNWKGYIGIRMVGEWVLAVIAIIFAAPIFLAIAVIIRLDSRGPSFFLHDRIGYRGRKFKTIKFRTMYSRVDRRLDPIVDRNDAMTLPNDPRITRVGRFLRKSRLDELPQIINILRGEMSLIGPRPEAVSLSKWYEKEIPFYHYRHMLRPGITGWAQVSQGHVTAVEDIITKLHYDFYYIKHASFWLDLYICYKTLLVIFSGAGAR